MKNESFLSGYKVLKIPIVDEFGDPVWPEMFPMSAIESLRKTVGSRYFSAQMMLEYIAEDKARLSSESLHFYSEKLDIAKAKLGDVRISGVCAYWDPSSAKQSADFDVSQLVLSDLRSRIRHALLADRLSILSDKEMIATEIIARNTDMMRILGATYGRLLNEFIKPLTERGLSILARRGLIDSISLHNDARLRYVAPITQLAADERVTQIMSWLGAANKSGFGDVINRDAAIKYLANALHIPDDLVLINKEI